ncbi:MAG: glycosyltransferase family 4 protein, partial [Deltaproteobacteria bacterium]|nr:glycosyltransferase family 4 protein [Deltaproteobacteria bacterium]
GRRDRETLLRAAQALPDLKFVIVDPEASSEWEKLEQAKLTNLPNVNWFRDSLPLEKYIALIRRAKLVIVAIRIGPGDGGHSTVSLAHRVGTPVIYSDVPGISDYVSHGHDAYQIPASDPEALAGAISSLWEDSAMRGKLSKNGRATEAARVDVCKQSFLQALSNAYAGLT